MRLDLTLLYDTVTPSAVHTAALTHGTFTFYISDSKMFGFAPMTLTEIYHFVEKY